MLRRLLFLCAAVAPLPSLLAPSNAAGQEGEIPDSLQVTIADGSAQMNRALLVILLPDIELKSPQMTRWRSVRDSLIRVHVPLVSRCGLALAALERWQARLVDPRANAIYEPPEVSIGYILAIPHQRPQLIEGYLSPGQFRDMVEPLLGHRCRFSPPGPGPVQPPDEPIL
jgi:hypothetical protein